jgi:mono/diheme cytochrome c family protein
MRTLIFSAALLSGFSASAQDVAPPGDEALGRDLYMRYCATCHGVEARGDGPMASILLIQPTDLTALSRTNNGAFPLPRVARRIDGRDPLVSHGSPMPLFGDFFKGSSVALRTPSGQPILTNQPVADLVAYIAGIQQ